MKKRSLSLALALVLCLGLLPATVSAANANLPDWYFLFAIFKNVDADGVDAEGVKQHAKYTMPQAEIDFIKEEVRDFEEYMNQVGVMRAHVEVIEIDTPVTELIKSNASDRESGTRGSFLDSPQAAPLLEGKVDLDRYDHVTCVISLNDLHTTYLGLTGAEFENGTGHSCVNLKNLEYCQNALRKTEDKFVSGFYVHEFLHFMERMNKKWGAEFGLHDIRINFYSPDDDDGRECYTDIILNRAKGNAGTGVLPAVWQYPPNVFRTMTEWSIPSGTTSIGSSAFSGCNNLKSVTIPVGVTSIGSSAFTDCSSLQSVTIPSGVTSIGSSAFKDCSSLQSVTIPTGVTGIENWTFGNCTALTTISIPSSVTSIGSSAFKDCSSLQSVTIPAGVTGIEDWTFGNCAALTWVSVPASVTSIGYAAFYNTGLKDVYYSGTEAQWKAIEIGGYNETLTKATIHYNSTTPGSQSTAPATSNAANPTNDSLEVNGKAAAPTVYKIGESNYFKIRDLAALLNGTEKQFAVGYDGSLNSVTATTGQGYAKQSGDLAGAATGGEKAAQPSNDTIYVNGKKVDAEVYKIDGSNYFKLRDLGKALNFYVGWTAQRGMYIETNKPYTE